MIYRTLAHSMWGDTTRLGKRGRTRCSRQLTVTAHPSFSPSHRTDFARLQLVPHDASDEKEVVRDEGTRSGVGHPELLREGDRQERSGGRVGEAVAWSVRVEDDARVLTLGAGISTTQEDAEAREDDDEVEGKGGMAKMSLRGFVEVDESIVLGLDGWERGYGKSGNTALRPGGR